MEPFNEGREVAPYPDDEGTVEELAKRAREFWKEHPEYRPLRLYSTGDAAPAVKTGDGPRLSLEVINAATDAEVALTWVSEDGDVSIREVDGVPHVFRMITYNPDSKWDWWVIGGRWRGFFQLKAGVSVGAISKDELDLFGLPDKATVALPRATMDQPKVGAPGTGERMEMRDGKPTEDYNGRADQARKRDIDFEAMRSLAGAAAEHRYDAFERATEGIEVARTWKDVLETTFERCGVEPDWEKYRETMSAEEQEAFKAVRRQSRPPAGGLTPVELMSMEDRVPYHVFPDRSMRGETRWHACLNIAREDYRSQPWIKALREADLLPFMDDPHAVWAVDAGGRETYIERARNRAGVPYNILMDGNWFGPRMGWFGMGEEVDETEWQRKVQELYDGLPDDAWLTITDCHI